MIKTNALRILDTNKISYHTYQYETTNEHLDAIQVSKILNKDANQVFKTLTCKSNSNKIYIFVIPSLCELDLKKAAKSVNEKSISMLPLSKLLETTGYVRGGCSPIGMKKQYPTIINKTALDFDTILMSAGKVGIQMELSVTDLSRLINPKFEDIVKYEN